MFHLLSLKTFCILVGSTYQVKTSCFVGSDVTIEIMSADINLSILSFNETCYPVNARSVNLSPRGSVIIQQTFKVGNKYSAVFITENIETSVVCIIFLCSEITNERSRLYYSCIQKQ